MIDAGDVDNVVYGGSGTDVIMAKGRGINSQLEAKSRRWSLLR
jgi:hypothetical protein